MIARIITTAVISINIFCITTIIWNPLTRCAESPWMLAWVFPIISTFIGVILSAVAIIENWEKGLK
jgi:hypothetical protein